MGLGTVTILSQGVYEKGIVKRTDPLMVCDWLTTFPGGVSHKEIIKETHSDGTAGAGRQERG